MRRRVGWAVSAAAVLASCFAGVTAQTFDLSSVELPGVHSLSTVARFFVWTKRGIEEYVPSFLAPKYGWGLWDPEFALHATISSRGLAYITPEGYSSSASPAEESPLDGSDKNKGKAKEKAGEKGANSKASFANASLDGLQVAVMEYDTFWSQFVPFQATSHFCCTRHDVAKGLCEKENELFLPRDIKFDSFVSNVNIVDAATAEAHGLIAGKMGAGQSSGLQLPGLKEVNFSVPRSGIYFLMFVNCNANPLPAGGRLTGQFVVRGAHGYLSGMDVPKLRLYALGSVFYAVFLLVWLVFCVRYRQQLILLHKLIGGVIGLSFLEQIFWFLTLSHTNAYSDPKNHVRTVLLLASIGASTLRNVSTCVLVLAACLGLSITRPSLERSTKVKIAFGAIALIVLDACRQTATHFHVSLDLSVTILMICALPITILYTVGFIWSFQSLNALLDELSLRRQTAKHRQLSRYRSVLLAAGLFFAASTIVETYVLSMDIKRVWPSEWIFTDLTPNLLYLFILFVTAYIWRPTRSSKYYSYNLQLPDTEYGADNTLDIDRIRVDKSNLDASAAGIASRTTNDDGIEIRQWGNIDLDLEVPSEPENPRAR